MNASIRKSRLGGHGGEFVDAPGGADTGGAVEMDNGAAAEDTAAGPGQGQAEGAAAEVADHDLARGPGTHLCQQSYDLSGAEVMEEEAAGDDIKGGVGQRGGGIALDGLEVDCGATGAAGSLIERGGAAIQDGQVDLKSAATGGSSETQRDIAAAAGDIEQADANQTLAAGEREDG